MDAGGGGDGRSLRSKEKFAGRVHLQTLVPPPLAHCAHLLLQTEVGDGG